jgi:hypothetical protein
MGVDLKEWAEEKGYPFHLSINTIHAFSHLDAAGGKPVLTLHVSGTQHPDGLAASAIQTHVYQVNFRVMVMTNIGFDANRSDSLYVNESETPLFEVLAGVRARILSYRFDTDIVHKGYALGGNMTELRELAETPFYGYALDFLLRCVWPSASEEIDIEIDDEEEDEEPTP